MRVLIGNSFSEVLVGRYGHSRAQWRAHMVVWYAEDGDIVVLPGKPDRDFVDYALQMKGVDPGTVRIVVPPGDSTGDLRLTSERLNGQWLAGRLRELAGDRLESVVALWPDTTIAILAQELGVADQSEGHAFMAQSGGAMANSKAVFRAVAAGNGVPVPAGRVCIMPDESEDAIWAMLAQDRPVMVKGDHFTSGDGNLILSRRENLRRVGAREMVVVQDRVQVAAFLAKHWERLTGGGRFRLVVEEYLPGCTPVFAEFRISDEGVELAGEGEMLQDPQGVGEIMPIQGRPAEVHDRVVDGGHILARALHGMGYRGLVSADAIITPRGEVFFTEFNGRITSSTHIYEVVGKRIVGTRYPAERVLFEKVYLKVPSFAEAERRLREAGLAFDPESAVGVILTSAYEENTGNVIYTSVGRDLAEAFELSEKVDMTVADTN